MIKIYKNQGYDVNEFNSFLEQEKLSLTSRTLHRYSRVAVMTNPLRIYDNDLNVAYHPFTIIEAIAAKLFFKGDWIKEDSSLRVPRLDDAGIRLGRALFMARGGLQLLNEKCKELDIIEYNQFFAKEMKNNTILEFEGSNLKLKDTQFEQLVNQFQDRDDAILYANTVEMLYRKTFKALLYKYGKLLAKKVTKNSELQESVKCKKENLKFSKRKKRSCVK